MGFVTSQAPTLAPSLRDAPAPVLDLRRFGPIRASFCRDSVGFLWESLDLVHTQRGLADLAFEAGLLGGPAYSYGYGGCYVRRLVPTPWGPRWRLINRCY